MGNRRWGTPELWCVRLCAVLAALMLAVSLFVPYSVSDSGALGCRFDLLVPSIAYAEVAEQSEAVEDGAEVAEAVEQAEETIEDEDVPLARATSVSNELQPIIFVLIATVASMYVFFTKKLDHSVSYMKSRFH